MFFYAAGTSGFISFCWPGTSEMLAEIIKSHHTCSHPSLHAPEHKERCRFFTDFIWFFIFIFWLIRLFCSPFSCQCISKKISNGSSYRIIRNPALVSVSSTYSSHLFSSGMLTPAISRFQRLRSSASSVMKYREALVTFPIFLSFLSSTSMR